MEMLKDEIHHCEKCDVFPCSMQDIVSRGDICGDCPIHCCQSVIIPLAPCEESKLEIEYGCVLKMGDNGWCWYYDKGKGCAIYEKRPVMCRVASCRFIREGKIPDKIRIIKEKMKRRKIEINDDREIKEGGIYDQQGIKS